MPCLLAGDAPRAVVLAIVLVLSLLVLAEGFESSLPNHGAELKDGSKELGAEALLVREVTERKSSAERVSTFRNRKFLRQGAGNADDTTQSEVLADFSAKGTGSDQFSGRDKNPLNRRMLIPATNMCTNKDISISQGPDGSSGIPRYFVQIVNTCMSDCAPSLVHVTCGWFASALLVNPNTFQRLAYNDCLVNGGKPLKYGEVVRFSYANSFMYPIRFKSAAFCR